MPSMFPAGSCARVRPSWLAACLLWSATSLAQEVRFQDSVIAYNVHRINTRITGAKVTGSLGLASVAVGAGLYAAGQGSDTRSFGATTLGFGLAHTAFAAFRLARLNGEPADLHDAYPAYDRYEKARKHFLLGMALDMGCIAAGEALLLSANHQGADKLSWEGYGKATVVQGVLLLLTDYLLFSAHQLDHSKWFRLMNEVQFTGRHLSLSVPIR